MTTKIIRNYYAIIGALSFAGSTSLATYVTFLISKGLNLFEVNFVNVVFFTTMFFLEVPTGVFADVMGRRRSFIISCLLVAIGEIVYGASATIWGFMLAEITVGLGRTFANGASHAWLIDTLAHHGFTGDTRDIFRKEQLVRQFASIPGAILGGYIGLLDLSYPWYVGGVLAFIVAIAAYIVMKEEYFATRVRSVGEMFREMIKTARLSMQFVRKDKAVRFIILMNIVIAFAVQAPNMQWQPFFRPMLASQAYLGYLWAGIAAALLAGYYISTHVARRFGREKSALIFFQIAAGVGLGLCVALKEYALMSLAIFLIHELPRAAYFPIKDAYLNDAIPSGERATIISCQSAYSHFGALSGLLISGAIAENYSINTAWLISAAVLVIIPLLLVKNGNN